jgi:hypothetical protein
MARNLRRKKMINFPTNPVDNEEFTSSGKTWKYIQSENAWTPITGIGPSSLDLQNYYAKTETDRVAEDAAVVFSVALG